MARIRTIKPGFFRSESVAALSFRAQLTWIGLWTAADDSGRAKYSPRLVKADLFPLRDDVNVDDVHADLNELERAGRITRYSVDGAEYLEIVGFAEHQKINRPSPSTIPLPPADESSPTPHVPLSESTMPPPAPFTNDSPQEGKGSGKGEGGGKEPPAPSKYCSMHPDGTDDNCWKCRDARVAFDTARTTARKTLRPPTADEADDCGHGIPMWDRASCRHCSPVGASR